MHTLMVEIKVNDHLSATCSRNHVLLDLVDLRKGKFLGREN